ncbi:hypothetical protein DFH27DRAFT_606082 [Peziza echinospora]|nr:hypothetical protein DFH27DRAFT_606082 [Peziza echinospora]
MATAAQDQHNGFFTKLQEIRDRLGSLRKDRTNYIKSNDVLEQYFLLCEQIRSVAHLDKDTDEQDGLSRIYLLITDCLLLVSLFFLTVGKNNEPPAAFAALLRLIQHLTESGNFSRKDLDPIREKLAELKRNIDIGKEDHPPEIIEQLEPIINDSYLALKPLQDKLDLISPQLEHLHEKLVSIRRTIRGCEARQTFSTTEVRSYKKQLDDIEATKIDGMLLGRDGTVPEGEEIVLELLEKCQACADEALLRQGSIAPPLRSTAERLYRLRSHLERLSVTQAWSLRETDLYDYIIEVQEIDRSRVDGRFVGEDGMVYDEGQDILIYLVRKCYAYVFSLVPVSESLTPIFNQLQTVRRCLLEVQKAGGVSSSREFYPYSMKLASIDNMRVDGKFMVGQEVPEGQGRVNSLLAECFEIMAELRCATEETPVSTRPDSPADNTTETANRAPGA